MLDPTAQAESLRALSDEWLRNLQRGAKAMELITRPGDPEIGASPRVEVYRRNKARLYRYEGPRTRRIPVLFVPNLGISRPTIFDLQPGASFVEYMSGQGFDFFLLDWGVYGEEDNGLTVDECVTRILPRVVKHTLEASGDADLLITHPAALAGPIVAEATGRPWVSTVLSPVSFFSVFDPMVPPPAPWLHGVLVRSRLASRAFLGLTDRMLGRWTGPVRDLRRRLGLADAPGVARGLGPVETGLRLRYL